MDPIRLSRLADDLNALQPHLIQEAAFFAAGQRGNLDPFTTAGRIIAEIIDAGGLEAAEFAPFRVAVRVVAESPKRQWSDVLGAVATTLPVSDTEEKPRSPLRVVPFVVSRVRHEVESAATVAIPRRPAADDNEKRLPGDGGTGDGTEETDALPRKGVAPRNEWFLEQYEAVGMNTHHSPKHIHDKWWNMPDAERKSICPKAPQKVALAVVRQGIVRARVARDGKKPKGGS
jgi:hypothetical protein